MLEPAPREDKTRKDKKKDKTRRARCCLATSLYVRHVSRSRVAPMDRTTSSSVPIAKAAGMGLALCVLRMSRHSVPLATVLLMLRAISLGGQ